MIHVTLNENDGTPLYLQLARQIKHLIATRRLEPEDELPPIRALAQQLVVNPNTVVRAYRDLENSGLIYKRRGAGTYVSDKSTPYTEEECKRILSERVDTLIVEARGLGWNKKQLLELINERDTSLDNFNSSEGEDNE